MIIKYNHPPVTIGNPFQNFNPNDLTHYPNGAGIYIYGFKKLIDGDKIFIPLYVGISKNLKSRLWQHFIEERSGGNSKWYIFDYDSINTISDVIELYKDMRISDSFKRINNNRFTNKLIWFNHREFFNYKLRTIQSNYVSHSGVLSSILNGGDLDYLNQNHKIKQAIELKDKIIKAKKVFDDDFYFVYSSIDSRNDILIQSKSDLELIKLLQNYSVSKQYMNGRNNGPGRSFCEKIEKATKLKLKEIKIETAAKAHGSILNVSIDLSTIHDCLINLNDHTFNDKNGNYIKQLVL
jgi:hypothetical protein